VKVANRYVSWCARVLGSGLVWRDDERIPIAPGSAVDIPCGSRHRIENLGTAPLVFVEVQHGTYFGEDDIVRFDDGYGRSAQLPEAAAESAS
jgi:mannose-6-phosphate isomerase-like protein (cupin superfamily)